MERRTRQRIELRLECHVLRPSVPSAVVDGVTINLSHGGALVAFRENQLGQVPKVDSLIEVEIPLPKQEPFSRKCLLCQASVVRVILDDPRKCLVALKFHRVRFRELEPVKRVVGSSKGAAAQQKLMVM